MRKSTFGPVERQLCLSWCSRAHGLSAQLRGGAVLSANAFEPAPPFKRPFRGTDIEPRSDQGSVRDTR